MLHANGTFLAIADNGELGRRNTDLDQVVLCGLGTLVARVLSVGYREYGWAVAGSGETAAFFLAQPTLSRD